MCHIQCCKKQGWVKPSDRLPRHLDKVLIRYKLYSDMRIDLAHFFDGKHYVISDHDSWHIHGIGHMNTNQFAQLKTDDVQYWHPISDLPKE